MSQQHKQTYRKKKKMSRSGKRAIIISVGILAAAVIVVLAIALIPRFLDGGKSSSSSSSQKQQSSSSLPPSSQGASSSSISSSSQEASSQGSSQASSSKPVSSHSVHYNSSLLPASTVPKKNPVEDGYFNDAVFIGDSRIDDFGIFSGLSKTRFYAATGLNVDSIFKKEIVKINGEKYTVPDALKKEKFKKVYVKLGINELGWEYPDIFIKDYINLLNTIKKTQPDAVVYVMGIINVSEKKSNADAVVNNKRIAEYNALIYQMTLEQGVHYLNVNEVLTDENGYLYADASTDGIHPNKKYCQVWLDFLKTHTV